jgi:hypothetical protein
MARRMLTAGRRRVLIRGATPEDPRVQMCRSHVVHVADDDTPRFWACVCGAGFCFGWFLLFLLADEDTTGQLVVTVVTATASALFAGAASFVRARTRRQR